MNKLEIIGNLTVDPVLRTVNVKDVPTKVTNFSIAVNERGRNGADGKPEPTYFRCHAWRQMAEICAEHLRKGRKVLIVGPVHMNSYKDSNGAIRYAMDVRIDDIEFLDRKPVDEEANDVPDDAPDVDNLTLSDLPFTSESR